MSPNPSPSHPLQLTDSQLDAIMHASAPLQPAVRSAFLVAVADALRDVPIGDGTVHRVCAELQRRYFDPPNLSYARGTPQPLRRVSR
jgi:hypothetical protein